VPATFNARAETVAEKPMFRSAFKRTRCIVPASGYYEWQTIGKAKQPYFISAAGGEVLSIAGLWDEWRDPVTGEAIPSATLIVTTANDFTRAIHDRMPVMLYHCDHKAWLTGKGRGEDAPSLIEPVEAIAVAQPTLSTKREA
jgi:putative SOS response-associated peptidase YedK